jgi:hypothetical protein
MVTWTSTTRRVTSPAERRPFHGAQGSSRQPTGRGDSLSDMPDLRIDWERVRLDADKLLATLNWSAPAAR